MKLHLFFCKSYSCICVFLVLFFLGCTEDDTEERLFSLEKFYADSSFLEIQGDLNDPHVIWGNVKTYLPAFERMKRYLYVENNRLCWDVVSGAELNISENIYDYVVSCWEGMNQQLEEGEGELELYKGYYRISYENVDNSQGEEVISRSDGDPVVVYGHHSYNMSVLFEITWDVYWNHDYGNLKNHLDLPNSIFRPDGIGGVRVDGEIPVSGSQYYGYYCANACAYMEGDRKFDCEFNDIVGWNRIHGSPVWYFKVLNINELPLITLRNANFYDRSRGSALLSGNYD